MAAKVMQHQRSALCYFSKTTGPSDSPEQQNSSSPQKIGVEKMNQAGIDGGDTRRGQKSKQKCPQQDRMRAAKPDFHNRIYTRFC